MNTSDGYNASPDFGMNSSFVPRGQNTQPIQSISTLENTYDETVPQNIENAITNITPNGNIQHFMPGRIIHNSNLGNIVNLGSNPLSPYTRTNYIGKNITNFSYTNPLANTSSIIKNVAHKIVDKIIDNV